MSQWATIISYSHSPQPHEYHRKKSQNWTLDEEMVGTEGADKGHLLQCIVLYLSLYHTTFSLQQNSLLPSYNDLAFSYHTVFTVPSVWYLYIRQNRIHERKKEESINHCNDMSSQMDNAMYSIRDFALIIPWIMLCIALRDFFSFRFLDA